MPVSQICPADSLLEGRIWETVGIFPKFAPLVVSSARLPAASPRPTVLPIMSCCAFLSGKSQRIAEATTGEQARLAHSE